MRKEYTAQVRQNDKRSYRLRQIEEEEEEKKEYRRKSTIISIAK